MLSRRIVGRSAQISSVACPDVLVGSPILQHACCEEASDSLQWTSLSSGPVPHLPNKPQTLYYCVANEDRTKPCACVCTHGHSVKEDERPAGRGIGDLASSQRFKPTWRAAGPRLWSDSTRFQSGQTTCQQSLSVVRASAEHPEQFALPTQHIDQLSNAEAIPSQIPRSGACGSVTAPGVIWVR